LEIVDFFGPVLTYHDDISPMQSGLTMKEKSREAQAQPATTMALSVKDNT
jgi:hypothetical protein